MQVLDEQKRLKILAAAAELFAAHPFHKVLLSDVAEAAGVGKGTLYIYFKNKEDLYLSVLYSGFAQLVERMQRRLDQNQLGPLENLEAAIREMVHFAYQNPHMFELMRTVSWRNVIDNAEWDSKRNDLKALIESIIRRGIACGEFIDPHPDLTARFIPGLVRSVLMERPQGIDAQMLTEHILRFARAALVSPNERASVPQDMQRGTR
jgi:AcrR family transcriptional regulator